MTFDFVFIIVVFFHRQGISSEMRAIIGHNDITRCGMYID